MAKKLKQIEYPRTQISIVFTGLIQVSILFLLIAFALWSLKLLLSVIGVL
jgi:hypothetical protein